MGVLPAADDLAGDPVDLRTVASHAAHDVHREANPYLLVVIELGCLWRSAIATARAAGYRPGSSHNPCSAKPLVSLWPELGAGPGKREVDVEEDPRTTPLTARG